MGTDENKGYDDKEGDGFFIGDFGDLCIDEEEVDELVFWFEGNNKIIIVPFLTIMMRLNWCHFLFNNFFVIIKKILNYIKFESKPK